jgi:hypothetical protein
LRAGPLSDKAIIRRLNERFVNTWVLNYTLAARRDNAGTADGRRLAAAVLAARQKASPVDCMVLTPGLEVVAVRPVHALLRGGRAGATKHYAEFLEAALGNAKR